LAALPTHAQSLTTTTATTTTISHPQVFLTGPQFKGIKMLPPGVHFLSFQARSILDGTLSPPVSTFLLLKPKQVFVRRWDPASEGLVELDEDEVRV
jgi:A1 cistron-splicing factor AAR2